MLTEPIKDNMQEGISCDKKMDYEPHNPYVNDDFNEFNGVHGSYNNNDPLTLPTMLSKPSLDTRSNDELE